MLPLLLLLLCLLGLRGSVLAASSGSLASAQRERERKSKSLVAEEKLRLNAHRRPMFPSELADQRAS